MPDERMISEIARDRKNGFLVVDFDQEVGTYLTQNQIDEKIRNFIIDGLMSDPPAGAELTDVILETSDQV